jgi:hypothetical protein
MEMLLTKTNQSAGDPHGIPGGLKLILRRLMGIEKNVKDLRKESRQISETLASTSKTFNDKVQAKIDLVRSILLNIDKRPHEIGNDIRNIRDDINSPFFPIYYRIKQRSSDNEILNTIQIRMNDKQMIITDLPGDHTLTINAVPYEDPTSNPRINRELNQFIDHVTSLFKKSSLNSKLDSNQETVLQNFRCQSHIAS